MLMIKSLAEVYCLIHFTGVCESGWVLHGNYCYSFSNEKATWTEAKNACLANSSHLATVMDLSESNFLITKINVPEILEKEYWIGLSRLNEGKRLTIMLNDRFIWGNISILFMKKSGIASEPNPVF